jgi:Protein of unknown function (DUF1631)
VLNGNITRVVENACHEELLVLNRGMGHLLGKPDLSTDANPLSPSTIVDAFAHAVQSLKAARPIKFQIMKDLNQAPLGSIASIYADLNAHLTQHNVVPALGRAGIVNRGGSADRAAERAAAKAAKEAAPSPEMDVMALFKRMYGSATPMVRSCAHGRRGRRPACHLHAWHGTTTGVRADGDDRFGLHAWRADHHHR